MQKEAGNIFGHPTVAEHFASVFGGKVRKIPVNAGLGCPNRDGTLGTGGCIYCNNAAFNPGYAYRASGSVKRQIADGVKFASRKGDALGYLAYFQSFSNTYGSTDALVALYEEALSCPGVLGLVVATRPDCLAPDLLDWMERRFGRLAPDHHPYLLVELGVESTLDSTLVRINRGHSWSCAREAILDLDRRGIAVGAHLILGLPGEGPSDWRRHVRELSALPVTTLKFHQLQVVRGTLLEQMYRQDPSCVHLFTPEEYARTLRALLPLLRSDIVLDRLVSESPAGLLVAPRWGLKPDEFAKIFKSLQD